MRSQLVNLILFILLILFFIYAINQSFKAEESVKVALIKLDGVISYDSNPFFSSVDVDYLIKQIKSLEEDDSIKGLILVINSPGGTPVAVDLISKQLDSFKEHKPWVAVIEEVGASGAYWIASNSSHIIAHPLSLVGSIGVTSSYLEFSKFLEEHNITYVELHRGKYKEIGSPFKELTPEEKEIFDKILDEIYFTFKERVQKSRNLSNDLIDEVANGQIFLGKEAKELGLVDELGTAEDAENYFKEYYNVSSIKIIEVKQRKGLFDLLFGVNSAQSKNSIQRSLIGDLYWQPLLLFR